MYICYTYIIYNFFISTCRQSLQAVNQSVKIIKLAVNIVKTKSVVFGSRKPLSKSHLLNCDVDRIHVSIEQVKKIKLKNVKLNNSFLLV